jgi:hypothetical protein
MANLFILIVSSCALAKKWLFWLCEGSALWVGQSQMCHLRAGLKLFLKNAGGKKIKNTGSAMSVGLLVVRLKYGLYVVQLSKWFVLVLMFNF